MPKKLTLEERFWRMVDKRGDDECWLWTGKSRYTHPFTGEPTYGFMMFDGRHKTGAHRISWMIHNNQEIPKGMCVLHKCDNPPCVNPAHLFLGTMGDNNRDKANKGRGVGNGLRGQDHGRAVLTEDQVRHIIWSLKNGVKQVDLARQFGVTHGVILSIKQNKTWRHIPRD